MIVYNDTYKAKIGSVNSISNHNRSGGNGFLATM